MPINLADHTKEAGNSETTTGLYQASQAVQNVIGASGASQGLQAPDVVGPIPNQWFNNTRNLVPLDFHVFIRSDQALGFPPCVLEMPFSGTLITVEVSGAPVSIHKIIVAKDRIVKLAFLAALTVGGVPYYFNATAYGDATFEVGDALYLTVKSGIGLGGSTLPAVGDQLRESQMLMVGDYSLWFLPKDE